MSLIPALGLIAALLIFTPLLLGGIFVILIVANRADPDVTGRRPLAVYAYAASFLTLFGVLAATTTFVGSLTNLIGSHKTAATPSPLDNITRLTAPSHVMAHAIGHAAARNAVLSGLVAMVLGLVFLIHVRIGESSAAGAESGTPVARVRSSYLAAVSFTSLFILVAALIDVIYNLFAICSPKVFRPGIYDGRIGVGRTMLPVIYLTVAALLILVVHLRQAPPGLRPPFIDRGPRLPGVDGRFIRRPQPPVAPPYSGSPQAAYAQHPPGYTNPLPGSAEPPPVYTQPQPPA